MARTLDVQDSTVEGLLPQRFLTPLGLEISFPPVDVEKAHLVKLNRGMSRLVIAVHELSLARDLPAIMAIVRRAARELTGAEGAAFVLREGDQCHYADEDAIAPLWKGQRFPMSACISGWTMLHKQAAVIEDIYTDPRIPADAYRPTFVKSLAMVPIRTQAPIGAIGNYWAVRHRPADEEVKWLQALANSTAVAMENVRVYEELEARVRDRTGQLEAANRELEAFCYAVSHDLGAPLRHIRGFIDLLLAENTVNGEHKNYLSRIQTSAVRMGSLIDDLLRLSRVSRAELNTQRVPLSELAREIAARLAASESARPIEWHIAAALAATGDLGLLRVVLENLLANAWKFTLKCPHARIEFGVSTAGAAAPVYFVRDNGAGFDMQFADQLFQPFRRLHHGREFPGTGIGLATVQRIIARHGGRIWAQAAVGQGATFFFTLGERA
jgi:hypothetical protein